MSVFVSVFVVMYVFPSQASGLLATIVRCMEPYVAVPQECILTTHEDDALPSGAISDIFLLRR